MPNRLAEEQSPYLLQHQDNPVDWYPWGEEAFAAARAQDKPVFLSVGYSTCHWCHVMEEESFEDEEVAAALNDTFIPVKVDREERPDVDNIYMSVCQMMTGRGGWPLTVLLTPDRKPFYAGTYLPKHGRGRRMGVMELTERVGELWRGERKKLLQDADRITDTLQEASDRAPEGTIPDTDTLDRARETLSSRFDDAWGGFGRQPKFPSPHNLLFLLREAERICESDPSGRSRSLQMVTTTLDAMRRGGLFDHVGFGFHRYATDRHWLLPHFEKMLYDQATLMMAYAEAYQVTGAERYAQTVREVLRYLERDLSSPEGAFYSAEDADSLTPEGEREEGAFYVWTTDEVRDVLDEREAEWVIETFNLEDTGNYADESTGQKTGANIFHLRDQDRPEAGNGGISWDPIRKQLLEAREQRPRPGLDDKVLTDWNGLLIAALAQAARVLPDGEAFEQAARRCARFLLDTMKNEDGRLLHRYRQGDTDITAHLDDYAFLGWGLIELYQTTLDAVWLEEALALTDTMVDHFHDDTGGGFYFTAHDAEALIVRQKEYYDGAMPSGNSVALSNLIRLARMTGRTRYDEVADRVVEAAGEQVDGQPAGFTGFLLGLSAQVSTPREIVIVGDRTHATTEGMIEAVRDRYLPNTVLLHRPPGESPSIVDLAPYTRSQREVDGVPAAYVCQNFACQAPVTSVEALEQALDG